jgi:hypothetical protein
MMIALVVILGILGSGILCVGMNKGEEKLTKIGIILLASVAIIAVTVLMPVFIVKGAIMAVAIYFASLKILKI